MPELVGDGLVEFIISFVNMLIALWMVPVIVAGQLLTNTFVYGEFLGFDKTLWHMWNMSKIFANYIIGFVFIGSIFRYFFATKEGDFNVIKSILPKIVIASLVVNMSWFILGFLLDISTLMIAALGNLPAVFINENPKIHKEATISKGVVINLGDNSKNVVEVKETQIVALDDILAWEKSAAGPLFYLGNSIIQINDLAIQDSAGEKKIENISPIIMIKIMVVLAFMIPIIILIVINLVRIFRIWLYIAFAPLIALDIVFGSKIGSKYPDNNAFVLENLLGMVFQPVLVVGALSLSVIMIAGIENSFTNPNDPELEEARKKLLMKSFGPTSSTTSDPYYKLDSMLVIGWKENLKKSGGPIGWFLLTFLSIFVMWALVKASFKFAKVAGKLGTKMMDFSQNVAQTVPILGGQSVGSLKYAGTQLKAFPESFVEPQSARLQKDINKLFGNDIISDMSDRKYRTIKHEFKVYGHEEDNYNQFKQLLEEQKITHGKDIEFVPNVGKLYRKLLKKFIETHHESLLIGPHTRFTRSKLKELSELDDDKFRKNRDVQDLLDMIIARK